jgi:beta-glucanase (GH16 family)
MIFVTRGVLTLIGLSLLVLFISSARAQCVGIPNCELVWSDEFDGTEVDTSKWSYQLGDGTQFGLPPGWGNRELQWYTENNATVADGALTITAREENVQSGWNYTSARLRTFRLADFVYGRFEVRAKMPAGKGLWPGFRMASTNREYGGFAASGGIDIVGYLGNDPTDIYGIINYGGERPNNTFSLTQYRLPEGTFNDDFHVFAIEWEEGEIRWYVDDVHYATETEWFSTAAPYPAPFDKKMHLNLNFSVGGDLPGSPDGDTVFPAELVVDYVRVYQEGDPPAVNINAGFNDAWYNPATNGQGFLMTVYPDIKQMFVAWFTYDVERPPESATAILGEPGHRWITAQGPYSGDTATLTMFVTEGGTFDSAEPPTSTDAAGIGTMTIEFADCTQGLVTYQMTDPVRTNQIPIQRIVGDNQALCETLNAQPAQ